MTIAVASGKGGTGKTTVATCLALSLEESVRLLDCDVEEPNVHFFLRCKPEHKQEVTIPVPEIDKQKCTACKVCVDICEYNALALIKDEVLVFEQLCHGCGGCSLLCPQKAISEKPRSIGTLEQCSQDNLDLVHGKLNIGEPMAPPLIREVKKHRANGQTVIIDSPPGTTCPMVVAVQTADVCLMVTENTPFGLHDLELSVEVVKTLNIPVGVIINRADIGESDVKAYCEEQNIPVLLEIPYSEEIAEAYSRGVPFTEILPEYRDTFKRIYTSLKAMAAKESAGK
jgi:MinD superfamily P-loop ATPase